MMKLVCAATVNRKLLFLFQVIAALCLIISLWESTENILVYDHKNCLCGSVVTVLGYRSRGPGSIPGATRFSEK
jgi:hypothetical protein